MSKTILITGSSSGFGLLTTKTLVARGYTVFASMRDVAAKNADVAGDLEQWAAGEGGDLYIEELDVTDEATVNTAVQKMIATTGRIDVVVNNAGLGTFGVLEAFPLEQMKDLYEVNVFGVQRVNRAVLPYMRKQEAGLLVHVSSGLGRFLFPFLGIYASTKWALEALAETYRYELAGLGIDSVIVEPGAYGTSFTANIVRSADQERFAQYGPVAEAAHQFAAGFEDRATQDQSDPQEVADAIVELIEMPVGERPLRTRVGGDTQAVQLLNETSARVQDQLLEMIGLKELATIR